MNKSYRKTCEFCKYNISCNYFEPYCDLADNWVSDEGECPLKKNKNETARKDGKGEQRDVKSSDED